MWRSSWGLLCALLLIIVEENGCQGQVNANTTTPTFSSKPANVTHDPTWNENQTEVLQCPKRCYCNSKGSQIIVDCSNASLFEIPEAIPPQVQYLSLGNNALTSIPSHAFSELSELRVLDLSHNQIDTVHEGSFVPLTQLQELNLHANLLNDVVGILNSLPRLYMLNVSNNRITDLDRMTLTNSSLRTLDAGHNQLRIVPNIKEFPQLESLHLQHNQIERLENLQETIDPDNNTSAFNNIISNISTVFPSITELDLSANMINYVEESFFTAFPNLHTLDLSENHLSKLAHAWGAEDDPASDSLWHLNLASNAFQHIPNDMFSTCCPNLTVLDVSKQEQLRHINSRSFAGLSSLRSLTLSQCPRLSYIHAGALSRLPSLQSLDISYIGLHTMHEALLPATLKDLNLKGVTLNCSCETSWIQELNMSQLKLQPENLTCQSETGENVLVSEFPDMNCTAATILTVPKAHHLSYEIGASAMFDCLVGGKPAPHVTWLASKSKHEFTYHPAFVDHSELLDPAKAEFHEQHYWHGFTKYFHHIPLSERIFVLKNGSLYIDYVTRTDAGQYQCLAENQHGNSSLVVTVTLDYNAILETKIWCVVVGFGSAMSFLLLGMIAGLSRWLAHFCSPKEKEKRRSIWELLVTIQEYKTEKVDVFKAYKDAKLDKISAFKNQNIDKLRTYKQDTVTNILTHMHSMREHYQGQMAKIKDNYSDQANRLRDNYSQHITKIKDYRQEKVDHLRANYQCQALKIRDYGAAQMHRLREQYKLQQQHMLKLLELLDIGNCMSVIEAECMRTESMLFDPDITFDLDDTAVHVPLPHTPSLTTKSAASDDSEYITACSVSDDNASADMSVSARTSSPRRNKAAEKRRSSSSSDNSSIDHSMLTANLDPEIQQMLLEDSYQQPRPPRKQRRKRRRHCSAQCHHTPVQATSPAQDEQKADQKVKDEQPEAGEEGSPGPTSQQNDEIDSSCVLVMDSTDGTPTTQRTDDPVTPAETIV